MLTFKDLQPGEQFILPKFPDHSKRHGPYTKTAAYPRGHFVAQGKGGYGYNVALHWEVERVEGSSSVQA